MKKVRDFDTFRDRLVNDYGVSIDDQERLWLMGMTREMYKYTGDANINIENLLHVVCI